MVVERRAVIVASKLNRRMFEDRIDALSDAVLCFPERALKSSIDVNSPIGNSTKVPLKPVADTITPATIGPRKNPAFPPERKIPREPPLEVVLDLTTAEKAGGWKAAVPSPAVPTRKSRIT